MPMEKSKQKPCKDESTDAEYRGGIVRSSNEPTEKVAEPRDCVIQF
jgi:hypothetical protein